MKLPFFLFLNRYLRHNGFPGRSLSSYSIVRAALPAAFLLILLSPWGELNAQQSDEVLNSAPAASLVDDAAQSSSGSATAVSPQATGQSATQTANDAQTRRILGIIPNFRAISSDEKLPPQTVKDKFITATQDSFDYSSIFIPALLAGYSLETNATPEFGHGGLGYGRYLWHSAVDQTSENYMVEFVVPTITRQDTRYYTLGHGGFLKRTGYALSRAIITRDDEGKEVFNASEVIGSGASAGLSSLYYPVRQRSFGNTGQEWGIDVAVDAISFEAKEFWPNINRWLFRGKQGPAAAQ